MNIGRKLYLTYGLMTAFVAIMVFGTTRSMEGIGRDFETLADQTLEITRRLEDMRAAGLQIVSSSTEVALVRMGSDGSESPEHANDIKDEIAHELRQAHQATLVLRSALKDYSRLVDRYYPREAGARDRISRYIAALIGGSDALLALTRVKAGHRAILESKEALEGIEEGFLAEVKSSLESQQEAYLRREIALRNRISHARWVAWWGLALVMLAIAALGVLMTRKITAPLNELTAAAERLGEGRLDVRVSDRSNDEIGILAKAFNRMAESLKSNIAKREAVEARLHEAQKLKAIGQLTGGVSHDFNNILAIIAGNAELIREKNPSAFRKEIDAICRASGRGSELTQRLLAYSRRQPLTPRSVDVPRLINEMEDMLRHSLGQGIEIATRWPPDLWLAKADPGQIESALLNLALNARHAMPQGGRFAIECANARVEAGAFEEDAVLARGDYLVLCVSDNGSGMSPEVAEQAFEPFFTTKDFGSGTGLGLSMVYGFAKQTGGHVELLSKPGRGTTVTLYLPRADRPADKRAPISPEKAPRGRGEKILVLEDERPVLDMVQAMLEGLGYDVRGVMTVDAAREALASWQVDLVLSDVALSGEMSGPEFVLQARKQRPDLKAVFMSGFAPDLADGGNKVGNGEVLINKPFQRRDLAATLRQALG